MPCCAGGIDTELLEEELAAQQRAAAAAGQAAHSGAGLVSLLVKPRIEIVNKDKLVASKGKLITVTGERCVCAGSVPAVCWYCMHVTCKIGQEQAGVPHGRLLAIVNELCRRCLCRGRCCSSCRWVHCFPLVYSTARFPLPVSTAYFLWHPAETFGEIPNGSAWCITTQAVPDLDETHLVVGRVVQVRSCCSSQAPLSQFPFSRARASIDRVEVPAASPAAACPCGDMLRRAWAVGCLPPPCQGMDVVEALAALPRVKDNTSSPFFQAGKLSGQFSRRARCPVSKWLMWGGCIRRISGRVSGRCAANVQPMRSPVSDPLDQPGHRRPTCLPLRTVASAALPWCAASRPFHCRHPSPPCPFTVICHCLLALTPQAISGRMSRSAPSTSRSPKLWCPSAACCEEPIISMMPLVWPPV